MAKDLDKVECKFCGKGYSKSGIINHEKACSKNPENMEKVEELKEEKVKEPELFDIKVNDKIECYIGTRYYRYKKGDTDRVPANVKDILKRAGMLEAL